MKILQLTVHFSPNVGGVETHLDDLVKGLLEKKHEVFVLTYRPLMTKTSWKMLENYKRYKVFRIPWISGLFYRLVDKPMLEFLYLLPGLFFVTPFVILLNQPEVVHAHGLVAGFVATFWGKTFGKRVVISTHSIYHFPNHGLYTNFVRSIFSRADMILTLSNQSRQEVIGLGIDSKKVKKFTYWIDLKKFKPKSKKQEAKNNVGWKNESIVLFVGRLVEEKGILVALEAAKKWDKNITLAIAGEGPLKDRVKNYESRFKNIKYLGRIEQTDIPEYYSAADIVLVPSTHEEGFGRVILESLACGTPVVAADRGAIPEAMDESVGRLIKITPVSIKRTIEDLFKDKKELKKLLSNTVDYSKKRYGSSNVNKIITAYKN